MRGKLALSAFCLSFILFAAVPLRAGTDTALAEDDADAAALRDEMAALEKEAGALQAELTEAQAETASTFDRIAEVRDRQIAAMPAAIVAELADLIPFWPYVAALVILLLLLVARPEPTVRAFHPGGIALVLRQAFARTGAPVAAGLRVALIGLAVVLVLLLSLRAFAAPADGGPTSVAPVLDLARQFVETDSAIERDRVALERLREHPDRRSYRPVVTKLRKTGLELYGRVNRGSFEHLYSLTAIQLEQNKDDEAVQTWAEALDATRRGRDRDYQRSLATTASVLAARNRFGAFEGFGERLAEDVDRVALLIPLSESLARIDAPLSERLLDKARSSKKGLEDTLALLGWEKRRGTTDASTIQESVDLALEQIERLRSLSDCAGVAETAQEAGFPDVARAALARGLTLRVRKLDDVEEIVRIALRFAYRDEAVGFVERAIDASRKVGDLLEVAEYAAGKSMPNVAKKAIAKAIESGRRFDDVFEVVQYVYREGDRASLEAALNRAIEKIRSQDDGARLSDYARRIGLEDFADRALLQSVVVLRRPKGLVQVLVKAVEEGKLSIAVEAAERLHDGFPRRRVRSLPAGLPLSDADLAPREGLSPIALAALLDLAKADPASARSRLEPLLPDLLDRIIFGELRRLKTRDARRSWNDFRVLRKAYESLGEATAERDLGSVLAVLEPIARIPRRPKTVAAETTGGEPTDEASLREAAREAALQALRDERDTALLARDSLREAVAGEKERLAQAEVTLTTERETLATIERRTLTAWARFLAIGVLVLLALYAALASGGWAAAAATRFKAYVFATRFVEVLGWALCTTIVGIPAGLLLVLVSQALAVLGGIHDATFHTEKTLRNVALAATDSSYPAAAPPPTARTSEPPTLPT